MKPGNTIARFHRVASTEDEFMTFPDEMELAVALYMAETASPRPKALETLLRGWLEEKGYLTGNGEEGGVSLTDIPRASAI